MTAQKIMARNRENKKLTQGQVANMAHISRAHYTNIETGARRPSPRIAQRIAKALGFDWKLFYEEKDAG